MIEDQFELENRKKYGQKENDVISQQFAISPICGIAFCFGNAQKYLLRYKSTSEKSNNSQDLIKTIDYIKNVCNREFLEQKHYDIIVTNINSKNIEKALDLVIRAEKFILNIEFGKIHKIAVQQFIDKINS